MDNTLKLSKAAERERSAMDDLETAIKAAYHAASKTRSDSTATVMSGQISAAVLILRDVQAKIDERTS